MGNKIIKFCLSVGLITICTLIYAQDVTSVNGATGNVQINLSLSGSDLSITGGNTVTIPAATGDITSVTSTNGLSGSATSGAITVNALTTSALWNANQLQGNSIATTTPTSGYVLKWNGSVWTPSEDNQEDGVTDVWDLLGVNLTYQGGNVGIGTSSPDELLTVNGLIHAEEIIVEVNVIPPDYVFDDGYNLIHPIELEKYIKEYKHLPEIPSAKEMETDGIDLSEMNLNILKKVEELALYVIDHEERISTLEKQKSTHNIQN